MFRQTIAIASLAIRAAVRSKLFLSLMIALLVVIVVLPITVKGDGTLEGRTVVLLYYTLGLATIVLAVTTVWSACWSISQEIQEKQLQLIATRPINRFQIWLGKWIGLMAINAALLCMTGLVVYGILLWSVHHSGQSHEDVKQLYDNVLVSRRRILPQPESVHDEAYKELAKQMAAGLPDHVSADELLEQIEKQMLAKHSVVATAASKQWTFTSHRLPANAFAGNADTLDLTPVFLNCKFATFAGDRTPLSGTWKVGTAQHPNMASVQMGETRSGMARLALPAVNIPEDQPMIVTFVNDATAASNVVSFDIDNPLEILVYEGRFEPNFARALFILFCHLSLLAAIGLTMSSLFSFPVATFVATSLLIVSLMGHYFASIVDDPIGCGHGDHDHQTKAASRSSVIYAHGIHGFDRILDPVLKYQPLMPLAEGVKLSWRFTLTGAAVVALLYPLIFGIVAGIVLRRREIALPGR
jgi:hypothetical protein